MKKVDWAIRSTEKPLNVPFWSLFSYFLMSRGGFKKMKVKVLRKIKLR